ncbi:MAG TPA: hypothetical protein PKG96_08750 [Bacilli bacterium]|nr:hypothetical protein [Bacilli bacterium]
MSNHKHANNEKFEDYAIIFKKLDELKITEDTSQNTEEIMELDQIRTLREIVLETTIKKKNYFTST